MTRSLPYAYMPPDGPMTPLVVSVPHAGMRVPTEDRARLLADDRTIKLDADLYVDRLYTHAPSLGAALLASTVTRFVIDVNRGQDEIDSQACVDTPSSAVSRPHGLAWWLSSDGEPLMDRPLTRAELDDRVARIWRPYHRKLSELLIERRKRFGYAILLDAHSMASVGRATHPDPGQHRAAIVPGDNHGASCTSQLSEHVREHFLERGFQVTMNAPYSGGYITRHYGRPHEGFHAIQLELNRALYLHEEVPQLDDSRTAPLISALDGLVASLRALRLPA